MDYRKHTKDRYFERFNIELSDDDYNNLCELSKQDNYIIKPDINRRVYKKIIFYNNKHMWIIYNRKNTIFTVYPIKRSHRKLIKLS